MKQHHNICCRQHWSCLSFSFPGTKCLLSCRINHYVRCGHVLPLPSAIVGTQNLPHCDNMRQGSLHPLPSSSHDLSLFEKHINSRICELLVYDDRADLFFMWNCWEHREGCDPDPGNSIGAELPWDCKWSGPSYTVPNVQPRCQQPHHCCNCELPLSTYYALDLCSFFIQQ